MVMAQSSLGDNAALRSALPSLNFPGHLQVMEYIAHAPLRYIQRGLRISYFKCQFCDRKGYLTHHHE